MVVKAVVVIIQSLYAAESDHSNERESVMLRFSEQRGDCSATFVTAQVCV